MKDLDINFETIEALAAKGYSVTIICEAIGINRSTAYKNRNIINTIKAGHAQAKQKVIDNLMARSEEDMSATAAIFLSKKLKIWDDYFTTSKPKNVSDAIKRISIIYESVARNELDVDKGTRLVGFLESYIKAFETHELEERLDRIEKLLQEK